VARAATAQQNPTSGEKFLQKQTRARQNRADAAISSVSGRPARVP